jgi:hypothetical protein
LIGSRLLSAEFAPLQVQPLTRMPIIATEGARLQAPFTDGTATAVVQARARRGMRAGVSPC